MRIAILNPVWDSRAATPEATLDRFRTLTGWAEALVASGALSANVFQRFLSDAVIERGGVTYDFLTDVRSPPHPPAWFAGARRLHAAVAGTRPDVAHVNGLEYPRLLRRLRRRLPAACAIVVQDHGGFDAAQLSAIRRAWVRHGLSLVDAVLVSSPGHGDAFRRSGLLPAGVSAYDVMESGTLLAPIDRARACETSGISGSPALLWVGRLNANKDPLTVVRGFARFAERHPAATLTFVYSTPADLDTRLRREVAASPVLASRVRMAGTVPYDRMASWYSAADIFVLGSHHEGSGYAAIEAMACGTIPVVTDIPSFRTLTGGGRIGALWEVGDPRAMCDALEHVMARPLEEQRAETRVRFEEAYSWTSISARAIDVYRDVMARRASRP